jgi:hypothetical protein
MKRSISVSLLGSFLGVAAILAQSQPIEPAEAAPRPIAQRVVVEPDLGPQRIGRVHVLPVVSVTAFVPRRNPPVSSDRLALSQAVERAGSALAGQVGSGVVSRVGHAMPFYAFGGAVQPAKD